MYPLTQCDNARLCRYCKYLPSDENLLFDGHLGELRSLGVNGGPLGCVDGSPLVDRVTNDVDNAAQSLLADGDSDGGAGVQDLEVILH